MVQFESKIEIRTDEAKKVKELIQKNLEDVKKLRFHFLFAFANIILLVYYSLKFECTINLLLCCVFN